VLHGAAKVSGRDLDDGRDAFAVRAFEGFPDVDIRFVATDSYEGPPTLSSVQLTPPGPAIGPGALGPRVSLTGHTRWDTLGRSVSPCVPDALGTHLTCGNVARPNPGAGTRSRDVSPRNRGHIDLRF